MTKIFLHSMVHISDLLWCKYMSKSPTILLRPGLAHTQVSDFLLCISLYMNELHISFQLNLLRATSSRLFTHLYVSGPWNRCWCFHLPGKPTTLAQICHRLSNILLASIARTALKILHRGQWYNYLSDILTGIFRALWTS